MMRKDAERKRELEVQQAERRAAEEEERRLQLAAALLIQATQRRRAAAGDATKRRAAVATLHAARKGFAVRRTLAAQREVDRLRVLRATFAASVTVQAARRSEAATPCVGGCNPMCHRAATPVFWVCGPMFLRLPRPCTAGGVAKAARGARGAAGARGGSYRPVRRYYPGVFKAVAGEAEGATLAGASSAAGAGAAGLPPTVY